MHLKSSYFSISTYLLTREAQIILYMGWQRSFSLLSGFSLLSILVTFASRMCYIQFLRCFLRQYALPFSFLGFAHACFSFGLHDFVVSVAAPFAVVASIHILFFASLASELLFYLRWSIGLSNIYITHPHTHGVQIKI